MKRQARKSWDLDGPGSSMPALNLSLGFFTCEKPKVLIQHNPRAWVMNQEIMQGASILKYGSKCPQNATPKAESAVVASEN